MFRANPIRQSSVEWPEPNINTVECDRLHSIDTGAIVMRPFVTRCYESNLAGVQTSSRRSLHTILDRNNALLRPSHG